MDPNWKNDFAPHILARGKKYFDEGRVSRIIQYGNRIVAHVEGTEDYCVEVELPGGVPDSWLCTCPYAVQGNCKHKAAILFAIEAGEYSFTGDPPEFEEDIPIYFPSLPWNDAIEKLPSNTIREILLHFADQDENIQERLAILYLRKLSDGLMAKWIANLQSYAREMSSGYRFIPEEDLRYFISGVRSALNERFILLRNVGAIMDAFYYLGAVFEVASKWVYPNHNGYFEDFYDDCAELWDDLFSEATEEQREDMHTWFWAHRAAFFAHANYEIDVDFLYHPWSNELERKSLEIVDSLIADCHNRRELELLMDCRVEIMDFLDRPDKEVWSFWKQHLDQDYARRRLLESYSRNKESRVHILPLLKQLKEMDADDLPRLIQDSVWLVKMYKEEQIDASFEAERHYLLTEGNAMLEGTIPYLLKRTVPDFLACLDVLRSLADPEIDQMVTRLVDTLCSNPSISRTGIVEMVNRAGYEWPKSYRFPG